MYYFSKAELEEIRSKVKNIKSLCTSNDPSRDQRGLDREDILGSLMILESKLNGYISNFDALHSLNPDSLGAKDFENHLNQ